MDRTQRVVALQRAYADYPNTCKMLVKLAAANFAELQETIELQLASLEHATLEMDGWGAAKRAELESESQTLYDKLTRLEQSLARITSNITAGRPN